MGSLEALARWCDGVVDTHRRLIGGAEAGAGSRMPCPAAVPALETLFTAGIARMRENGELRIDADPARLATCLTAAFHGGSLLARTTRDIAPLDAALDLALSHIRAHAAR